MKENVTKNTQPGSRNKIKGKQNKGRVRRFREIASTVTKDSRRQQ